MPWAVSKAIRRMFSNRRQQKSASQAEVVSEGDEMDVVRSADAYRVNGGRNYKNRRWIPHKK